MPPPLTNIGKVLTGIPQAAARRGRQKKSSHILDHSVRVLSGLFPYQSSTLLIYQAWKLPIMCCHFNNILFCNSKYRNGSKTSNRSKSVKNTWICQLAQDHERDYAIGQLSQMEAQVFRSNLGLAFRCPNQNVRKTNWKLLLRRCVWKAKDGR